ncbi:hypothetical protein SKAU_G00096020 [Synaphobranchus kaupii]|uniref:Uncharacterized protein n=1 Tax=Synaphobranchus kaupii TaxID=118154 RepID=A0A9Q1J6N6_SYNKA|nr:hypothetical protein SKAU_G00096020 [Synaphobranchus kaupii]
MFTRMFHSDWYPNDIQVEQVGLGVIVTFNLAPPNLGINQYFSWCYGGGLRNYTTIKVNPTGNKTHHSYQLLRLKPETSYSCELAADVVDAIRKTFSFQVTGMEQGKHSLIAPPMDLCLYCIKYCLGQLQLGS